MSKDWIELVMKICGANHSPPDSLLRQWAMDVHDRLAVLLYESEGSDGTPLDDSAVTATVRAALANHSKLCAREYCRRHKEKPAEERAWAQACAEFGAAAAGN